jgi:hypothetical protein
MTSHMKKKAKRYQEGGEAEDKKRGLAASNKEGSVGFFERLRMGNIDDPKSEAHKRFGAGRGQAETAKEKAAIKSYKGPSEAGLGSPDSPSPFTGSTGERAPAKAAPAKAAPAKAAPAKAAAKKPAEAPIVTQEQLKASGFDNLRDYLNDRRGLKRRVKKDSEGKTASGMSREARGVRDDSMSDKDRLRAQLDSAKESSQAGRYGTMKRGGVVKSSAPKMGKVKTAKPSMGGASKRADGIAKKGKTRGKMV